MSISTLGGERHAFPGKIANSALLKGRIISKKGLFLMFCFKLHVCSNKNERKERIQEDETGATIYIGRVLSTFLFNVQTNAVETSQAAKMFEKNGKVSK